MTKILLIGGEDIGELLKTELRNEGYDVTRMNTPGVIEPIIEELDGINYGILVAMGNGFPYRRLPALVSAVRISHPSMKVLAISGCDDLSFVIELKKCGVDDYITMPFVLEDVVQSVKDMIEK